MTAIRCEKCKGIGIIKIELSPYTNVAWKSREEIEDMKIIRCPACGGCGCKWEEDKND